MLHTPENIAIIAEGIARGAHAGQRRRDGSTPYIAHVAGVVRRLRDRNAEELTIAVAWLHDTLEDTAVTPDDLKAAGMPDDVIYAVRRLTRSPSSGYEQYLAGVKEDPATRAIKVADILDNLADSPTEKQILRYSHGLQVLIGETPVDT